MESVDIANLCESLSLSDKDGPILKLDSDLQQLGTQKLFLCLVGKLITNKVINREAFRAILPKIWRTSHEFLQIRVSLDFSKPLKRCVRMELDGSRKASTILLRYECLPEFYFYCGLLGHAARDCVRVDQNMLTNSAIFYYGGWLCGSSPVRVRRNDRNVNSPVGANSNNSPQGPRSTSSAGLKQQPDGISISQPALHQKTVERTTNPFVAHHVPIFSEAVDSVDQPISDEHRKVSSHIENGNQNVLIYLRIVL
ncbi:hypothetical protein ACOSQ4_024236 [Xanthoceras sorbifolium]